MSTLEGANRHSIEQHSASAQDNHTNMQNPWSAATFLITKNVYEKTKKNNVPYRHETNVLNTSHSAKIMLHYAEIHSCITRSNAKPKRL